MRKILHLLFPALVGASAVPPPVAATVIEAQAPGKYRQLERNFVRALNECSRAIAGNEARGVPTAAVTLNLCAEASKQIALVATAVRTVKGEWNSANRRRAGFEYFGNTGSADRAQDVHSAMDLFADAVFRDFDVVKKVTVNGKLIPLLSQQTVTQWDFIYEMHSKGLP